MKTTESPDYELIRLVSDIGGQLGLWIGISVITLVEVVQLVLDIARKLASITRRRRHVTNKSAVDCHLQAELSRPISDQDPDDDDVDDWSDINSRQVPTATTAATGTGPAAMAPEMTSHTSVV